MEKTITITMDGERHKALKKYLKKKTGSTIEKELEAALDHLFDKTVPPAVRDYLEEDDEDDDGSSAQKDGRK